MYIRVILLGFLTFFLAMTTVHVAFSEIKLKSESNVLTVDIERLLLETNSGMDLLNQINKQAADLQLELNEIEQSLSDEENKLVEIRENMNVDEFRKLAKAFDEKAVNSRNTQAEKIRRLNEESLIRRQRLVSSFVPILREIMEKSGASILLDRRNVILDDPLNVDITDLAIDRINGHTSDFIDD